jgi:hypothetical protein
MCHSFHAERCKVTVSCMKKCSQYNSIYGFKCSQIQFVQKFIRIALEDTNLCTLLKHKLQSPESKEVTFKWDKSDPNYRNPRFEKIQNDVFNLYW